MLQRNVAIVWMCTEWNMTLPTTSKLEADGVALPKDLARTAGVAISSCKTTLTLNLNTSSALYGMLM